MPTITKNIIKTSTNSVKNLVTYDATKDKAVTADSDLKITVGNKNLKYFIIGGAKNNTITSGDKDDVIDLGAGQNNVKAGKGNDSIYLIDDANNGTTSTIDAGAGDDFIETNLNSTIITGAGKDIVNIQKANNSSSIAIKDLSSEDKINLSAFKDFFQSFNEFINSDKVSITDTLSATSIVIKNTAEANAPTTTITLKPGQLKADNFTFGKILNGTPNGDVLTGGAGDDNLFGGLGNDTLAGGKGKDIFVFSNQDLTSQSFDVIKDFQKNLDLISFEQTDIRSFDQLSIEKFGDNIVCVSIKDDTSDFYIQLDYNSSANGNLDVHDFVFAS